MTLDLYDYGDGGGEARTWQRRRNARKNRAAALKAKRAMRDQEKTDYRKRMKKWRANIARAKASGWARLPWLRFRKPDGTVVAYGRPRVFKKPIWADITGHRFGRLTAMRICPTSQQGCQRCRYWWVKCDCGSPEHRVNGTNMRQGRVLSCGCLRREILQARKGEKRAKPVSVRMLDAAAQMRAQGNIKVARLLEIAAPTMRRKERTPKRKRRATISHAGATCH